MKWDLARILSTEDRFIYMNLSGTAGDRCFDVCWSPLGGVNIGHCSGRCHQSESHSKSPHVEHGHNYVGWVDY